MKELIDISPPISEAIAVFPGDTTFQKKTLADYPQGHSMKLSTITSTIHLGAHADAPIHYHSKGESIEQRSLHYYYGECQVIHVNLEKEKRIYPKHIEHKEIKAARILFRTDSFPDPNTWCSTFNSLSPELIEYLAKKQVKLVGIDTPSVDPANSKKLESHHTIYKYNMAILEGLVLKNAEESYYKLIALPLPLKDLDASPVRAVLEKL